ncbi:MAG: biotin synthase BioB [PVC group bacterium]|nr:biotin synthase BioB [PVC group bacterium]
MGWAGKEEWQALIDISLPELIAQADKVRKQYISSKMELCSIINAKSGVCGEDCKFCAQSSHYSTDISTFSLEKEDKIIQEAQKAKDIGAGRFGIVTSGNRLSDQEICQLSTVIKRIRSEIGIDVCASLGALKRSDFETLKKAGLSRYHHNIETSRRFYPQVVSTHNYEERINTVKAAKETGLDICSGGIIGMGESWQDRIEMACTLKELDVDSVPLNILVPIKGTPFETVSPISCSDVIRTICIFRIILKDKTIKIAAGREAILKDFQAAGFMAGANGMLIGGYLTIKGRDVQADQQLCREIETLWKT